MAGPEYRHHHRQARAKLLSTCPPCYWCGAPRATIADHDPPIATMPEGQWRGVLRPSCVDCSLRQAGQLRDVRKRMRRGIPAPSRPW